MFFVCCIISKYMMQSDCDLTVYICRVIDCSCRLFSARALISHMTLCHSDNCFSEFMCNLDSCTNTYRTVDAFRKHLAREHAEHWNSVSGQKQSCTTVVVSEQDNTDDDDDIHSDMDVDEEVVPTVSQHKQQLAKCIAFSKLKTMEMHMLPKSVNTAIFDNTRELVDVSQFGLQNIVRSRLTEMGVNYKSDPVLGEALGCESFFDSAASACSSDHLLRKFCRDNMNLVEPVPIYVADHERSVLFGHYVPVLPCLTNYLQHSDVWASIHKSSITGTKMRDYTDGLIWQSHALGHNHLRLHLYTDEFEVCNPIGSRKNVHKVCAFYYSVGNVELKYRSQLKNIHLACLLKYKCVRQYGYSMLIKDMIRDLKTLESDGIEVIVDQEHFTVNGSVVTVSGDNLSLHALGGFNPVFSSGRICRHCMVCYSNLRKVHSEEQCTMRNEQTHQYHVDSIVADARLKPVYGVYAESPLSSLNYFSPVSCLPPDVMHDILEGVMTLSVELVLKTLVLERVLDMKTVTRCMQTFEYGCSDTTDRPEPLPEDFVTKNKSVSGKAVEKWCLFRLLPLYIGNLVSEDYAVWKLYLLCRRICEMWA